MGSMFMGLVLIPAGLLIALSAFVPSLSPDWTLVFMGHMRASLRVSVMTASFVQFGLGLTVFLAGCYFYSSDD